jgi:hypothetical protein
MAAPERRRRGARARRWAAFASVSLVAACAVRPYEPWPVDLPVPVPGDLFERCRGVVRSFAPLAIAEPEPLRLQTGWTRCTVGDSYAERRASVFRVDDRLGVVVEIRYWEMGSSTWSAVRGDPERERELGEQLRSALQ